MTTVDDPEIEPTPDTDPRNRRQALIIAAIIAGLVIAIFTVPALRDRSSISFEGALEGMRGPRPIAVRDAQFRAELNDVWLAADPLNNPLVGFDYAAEAYDAVILAALAAEAAGTDGASLADEIIALTTGSTSCAFFVDCRDLIRDGVDIDYRGVSGPLVMNSSGENIRTNFSVVTFGEDNRIDDALTEYVELVGSDDGLAPDQLKPRRSGDGTLVIGALLPLSGQLATYGPSQQAAIRLAIDEINFAGGVLDNEVVYLEGDSGDTSSNRAEREVERLIDQGADVIIGPTSTAVTVRVIDQILDAGLIQISPANTNVILSGFDDDGRYFRIAPSDDQQAYLLADLIAADGLDRVGIFAIDDMYGNAIADRLEAELTRRGIEVVAVDRYAPVASSYAANVDAMRAAGPQGIVVISFEEGARLLREMVRNEIGPRDVFVYGVDSNMGNGLGRAFDIAD